ncbi:MAG: magnesium/cobalt transporter CorA [Sedimentisphaerales bacterium]|nr:magnesium/cobalt transporter CorA [Sedimentisphaerales bacterium]
MAKIKKRHSAKAGLPPGTLVYLGEEKMQPPRITVIDYDQNTFTEKELSKVQQCFEFKDSPTVSWINIDGIHEVRLVEEIGERFGLHSLVLEDILNTAQRPKLEDFDDHIFIVLKMLTYDEENTTTQAEQVSLVLGRNFVISFQERPGDVFEQIRERIRNAKGRIRKMSSDYLAYSLIDAIVDNYYLILEKCADRIETLEEQLVTEPDEKTLHQIHKLKREFIYLRKSVWPLREVINLLQRSESGLINKSTGIYLRDVYDHTIQIIDTVETLRDMVSGMLDIYLSSISNRMNSVMKVLTIIATIFIPLSFLTGVYGMNFENMPELRLRWTYPVGFWLIIVVVVGLMLVYFRRKKWL